MPTAHVADVEKIRLAMVALRRLFQRKSLAQDWESAFGRRSQLDYTELRLLDAVRVARPGEATVGEVSRLLGVDASRASRLVTRAIEKGLLARALPKGDARKVLLRVTARGAKLQQRGSDLTRARIELAVKSWPKADRKRFAKQLGAFVSGMVGAEGRT
jgi:DNA-binding MarR family transcriptional regulator